MKSKRALRRHHRNRIKEKIKRENYWSINDGWIPKRKNIYEIVGQIETAPCTCSNPWCCGNPRRLKGVDGRTLKEKQLDFDKEMGYYEYIRSKGYIWNSKN